MNASDFLNQLARLEHQHPSAADNPGSFRCVDCDGCAYCMFSEGCKNCYKVTYCKDCRSCTHCSHSRGCDGCHQCAYCIDSTNCLGGSYLVKCSNCTDCTYCFGCVGLVRREFHILNVRYSREEYFAIIKQLARQLNLSPTP